MFPRGYFPPTYFSGWYWPEVGGAAPPPGPAADPTVFDTFAFVLPLVDAASFVTPVLDASAFVLPTADTLLFTAYFPPAPFVPPVTNTGSVLQAFPGQATHSWTEGLIIVDPLDGGILVGGTCDYSGNYTGGLDTFAGCTFTCVVQKFFGDGVLYTGFANFGTMSRSFGGEDDELSGLVVQGDGKIVCAGIHWTTGNAFGIRLWRLNADGTQDLQFGSIYSGNVVSLYPNTFRDQNCQVQLQSTGKVILYTTDVITASNRRLRVARFHQNGSLDTTFGPTTTSQGIPVGAALIEVQPNSRDTAGPPYYGHVLVQSDDKIVVGGSHDTSGSGTNYKGFVTRILSDGSASDSGFGANIGPSPVPNGTAYGLLVDFGHNAGTLPGVTLDSGTDIICVGDAGLGGGITGGAAALLDTAGALVTSFNGTGFLTTVQGALPFNFFFQPAEVSGKLFAFGMDSNTASTVDVTTRGVAVGWNADGTLYTSFASGGAFVDSDSNNLSVFFDVLPVSDGFVTAGHRAYDSTAIAQARLLKLTSAGALDTSWGDTSPALTIPTAPTVVTGAASNVTATSATLAGTVNPNGTATVCHFEWGPDTNYGQVSNDVTVGSQSTPQSVSINLTGLIPGNVVPTTHYRLVALAGTASTGMAVGSGGDATFSTSAGTFTLLHDIFDDVDNLNVRDRVANTDYTGGAYIGVKGISTIQGNKVRWDFDPGSGAGNKQSIVQHEAGTPDVTVTAPITWNGSLDGNTEYQGVFARCAANADGSGTQGNFLHAGWTTDPSQLFRILSLVGGVKTVHASTAFVPVIGTPYTITLTATGTSCTATLNPGGLSLTGTPQAALAANTQCGWILNYGIGDTVDDLTITTP